MVHEGIAQKEFFPFWRNAAPSHVMYREERDGVMTVILIAFGP